MSITENKELVRQIVKEWNAVDGDVAKIHSLFDKYYAPSFIYHNISIGDTDQEQTKQYRIWSRTCLHFRMQITSLITSWLKETGT